MNGKIIIIKKM